MTTSGNSATMPGVTTLLELDENGLFCPRGGFYIDPWRPVDRAVITHGHGDHARFGSRAYLAAARSARILETRLGTAAPIQTLPFGETRTIGGVTLSFHPAGHILGSAQVRLEAGGEVAVVSGDYKTEPDRTCDAFEPLRCDTFVTESTFGLPIYRWPPEHEVITSLMRWWEGNQREGLTSVVYAYALGKAQRVLAGLDESLGPIGAHGAVVRLSEVYRSEGIALPACDLLTADNSARFRGKGLVVAPPSVQNTAWLRKLAPYSTAFASGWMLVRGQRRRRGVDRGFPLSDHADWRGLREAITATGAASVWVTHGYTGPFVRFLRETGFDARELHTEFRPESDDEPAEES